MGYEEEYDGYFIWLCSLVDTDMSRYSELLYRLHDTDFVWCLDRDDGRAADGLALREEYCSIDIWNDWVMLMEKPCSVLEALIGLARRMDDMLSDDMVTNHVRVWFWEFIKNLGLKRYSNIVVSICDADFDIQMILSRWMNREFDFDGSGSLFPLDEPCADQREKTIIYQLNAYVLEKYL